MADPVVDPCTLPLVKVDNEFCATTDVALGKQIPVIIYQDPAGSPPDLITIQTGGDTRLSTLQTSMTASGADRTFILKNIAGATVASADTTLTGNDVPYGGTRITDRIHTLAGRLDFITPSNNKAMNNLNKRQRPVRHWEIDEFGIVQGPFENSSIVIGGLLRAGIGGAPTHRALTVSGSNVDEPDFAAAPLVGIQGITNA